MTQKKTSNSFQQAFTDLERIVVEFEKGDMDLDESLKKFEQGLELADFCKKRLADIENRVIEIKKKFQISESHTQDEEGDDAI